MTDEQIEKALKELSCLGLSDESAYDSCGRLVYRKEMEVTKNVLAYINRLKAENAELKEILDIANNREWRKKFISEVWQEELRNELSTPDFDFVYKLYFEQREKLYRAEQKLAECENGHQGTLDLERRMTSDAVEKAKKDTAKEIFKTILDGYKGVDYWEFLFDGLQAIADSDYGIIIMEDGDKVSVEVNKE